MGVKKKILFVLNIKHAIFMELMNTCSRVGLKANW